MITKNFKRFLASILQVKSSAATAGYIPVVSIDGITRYLGFTGSASFPWTITTNVIIAAISNPGIYIGRGNTAPSENDYTLETPIISGLIANTPTITQGADGDGNPFIKFLFTLTNNTSSDVTVSEIGYFQTGYVSNTLGNNTNQYYRFMLDRTVLSNPVTVPANGSAAIEYTLKTIL